MKLWPKLTRLFRRKELEAEMVEELRTHLELQAAENERRGLSPADARYAAQRAFGGVEQVKERVREQRGGRGFDELRRDVRFSGRMMVRHPGFALAAVLTLGLGIGFVTALFTIINGVLLRGLPVPDG